MKDPQPESSFLLKHRGLESVDKVVKFRTYTYFVSSATTNACNQIHPESATIDASSISLFSKAYACMVMTKTTIA